MQSPHDHAWHARLMEILVALSHRQSPSDEQGREEIRTVGWALNNVLWADLPLYNPEIRHGWDDAASLAHSELSWNARIHDEGFVPIEKRSGTNGHGAMPS